MTGRLVEGARVRTEDGDGTVVVLRPWSSFNPATMRESRGWTVLVQLDSSDVRVFSPHEITRLEQEAPHARHDT